MTLEPKYMETQEEDEFFTAENCHIIELLNNTANQSFSIARARVLPGETTKWHALKGTTECYYILSGIGLAELGADFRQAMKPHSLLRIPADQPQRITNTGEEDLVILCICSPAFSEQIYTSLE